MRVTNRRPALAGETTVNVTMTMRAFDGYSLSEPGVLTITVIGVNDAPHFSSRRYNFSIDETQVPQFAVLFLHVKECQLPLLHGLSLNGI